MKASGTMPTRIGHMKNRATQRALIIIIFFFVFVMLIVLLILLIQKQRLLYKSVVSPIAETAAATFPQEEKHSLSDVINTALTGATSTYAVVVKNITTGETYAVNEHMEFETASLYKLWVMATVFEYVSQERLRTDDVLSQDIAVLNEKFNISSESAELSDGVVQMSLQDAVEQMITISHNYAALLLSERIGNSKIQKYITDNGYLFSSLGDPPKTTASDIAQFFEKLYFGKVVTKSASLEMIDILKKQTLNSKIPKYLPKSLSIAHKTGELGRYSHDAGIIYTNKGDYIVVVLSEGNYPPGADERIAQISFQIYKYFTK